MHAHHRSQPTAPFAAVPHANVRAHVTIMPNTLKPLCRGPFLLLLQYICAGAAANSVGSEQPVARRHQILMSHGSVSAGVVLCVAYAGLAVLNSISLKRRPSWDYTELTAFCCGEQTLILQSTSLFRPVQQAKHICLGCCHLGYNCKALWTMCLRVHSEGRGVCVRSS